MSKLLILVLLLSVYILVPIFLYKKGNHRMAKFCYRMTISENCRRFFLYNLLLAVIVFHFAYFNAFPEEWGLMVSTIPMVMMFSTKWFECFIRRLVDNKKKLYSFVILTLVATFTPHMYTLAVTFFVIIIGVAYYPSTVFRKSCYHSISCWYKDSKATGDYSGFVNGYFGR